MLRPGIKIFLTALLMAGFTTATAANDRSRISLNQTITKDRSITSSPRTTKAKSGDTISRIAARLGVTASELARINGVGLETPLRKGTKILLSSEPATTNAAQGEVIGNRITLSDGYSFEADEVFKQGDEMWYRKGKITERLPQTVQSVKPIMKAPVAANAVQPSDGARQPAADQKPAPTQVWIHLVDGARFRVDDVQETSDGAWYSRKNVSIFLAKERISSIQREDPSANTNTRRGIDWSSGNPFIDQLIRTNATRFDLDPYLVFLVIEQESQFKVRAVSPKGARGLMQLMPGTASRLGVRQPFDAAENIRGGTRYLKELMDMFGGKVNLVLASYNAGEGAVLKYGRNVPPYRETREYVRRISKRYGLGAREVREDDETLIPRR